MTEDNTTTQPPSTGERIGSAFRAFILALFRLIIIAALLAFIGVVVFWGIPQIVRPIQDRMQSLEEDQQAQEDYILALAESVDSLQRRIANLETQNDTTKQQIDELNSQLAEFQSAQSGYLEGVVSTQEANMATFEEISTTLDQIEQRLRRLSVAVEQSNARLAEVENEISNLDELVNADKPPIEDLQRDLQLVKAMGLLTRSRLFIVENNLGLAEEDILAASELLSVLSVPEDQQENLDLIIVHLNLAIENLPGSPVLAAENLEIAWQLLRQGVSASPVAEDMVTETSTIESDQTTPEPEGTPTATPTPTSTN